VSVTECTELDGDGFSSSKGQSPYLLVSSRSYSSGTVSSCNFLQQTVQTLTEIVPENAKWLDTRQREVALARVQTDKANRDYDHPTIGQNLRMLLDWKLGV
jgi:hypothetical protein